MTQNGSDRRRFGPFEVDLHTRELWKYGTRLRLVGQPFEILAVLLSRPGQLVTRDELRTKLWPADTFVDFNHGLNAAVNKLREALSDSADDPRYIETLPRRGYRFIAALDEGSSESATPATPPAVTQRPVQLPEAEAAFAVPAEVVVESPARRALPRYLMGAGLLSTAALAAILIWSGDLGWKMVSGSRYAWATRPFVEHTRPLLSIQNTNGQAFSPDGNQVAFYRQRSPSAPAGIYVTPVGSDRVIQLTSGDDDCCPVWSSDARWIAFSREQNHEISIYLAPADGGGEFKRSAEEALAKQAAGSMVENVSVTAARSALAVERKLETGGVAPQRGEIDWSPDGRSIVFSGPSGLYLLSLETSRVRRVTEAPTVAEDWGPKFDPEGKKLMFVRTHQIGVPDEIWITAVEGGEAHRLLSEPGKIASPPQWSYDGKSVIFSSNRTGHPALWRVSIDAPDSAVQISEAGSPAWDPAVSRRGYRLAYDRLLRSLSVWQMNLGNKEKRPELIVSSTSDTDQGPGPHYSPDGKRLAYMSDRSGTMEIWVANRDGSNAFQLTAVGGAGTPRWSPDSQALVFDVTTAGPTKIVSMNLHGGAPQILTPDTFHSVCPSWSHDGKWIYFGSTRSGKWQIWKVPASGGMPIQVTQNGGHAALESVDRKYLYYSKDPNPEPEIWRVPVKGGEEKLMPLVRPGTWASWQAVQGGILFVGPSLGHQAVVSFYDFASDRTTILSVLDRTPFWLGATPNGKTIAFDQPGREQLQSMLVENFR